MSENFGLNDWDLRVDVYNLAIPLRQDRPDSWPTIRAVHIPTGFVETDRHSPSQVANRQAAVYRLAERIRA